MIHIICNPTAGNGRAKKIGVRIEELLRQKGRPCRLLMTQQPGHAALLAQKAREDNAEMVLAVGGDGTAYEVASGLLGPWFPWGSFPPEQAMISSKPSAFPSSRKRRWR